MHLNLFTLYNSSGHVSTVYYESSRRLLKSRNIHWYLFISTHIQGIKELPSILSPFYPLRRDLCAPQRGLCVHASQVCGGGQTPSYHRLPQLDTVSSAGEHGEHPRNWGARPGETLHQGVPQLVGAQWSGTTPQLKWPKPCSLYS